MPVVIHSPFVPGPEADLRGYQFASDLNQGTQRITDLLLQAILSGQLARTPTQGRYVSPSGQGTFLSPAEQVAGNPTRTLSDVLRQQRPPGSQFSRAGLPFRLQPPLTRELQQAQLQQAQIQNANAPLEAEKLREETRRLKYQADLYDKAAKGEVTFQTLADGTVVPVFPSTTGPKPGKTDEKDDLADRLSKELGAHENNKEFKIGDMVKRGGKTYKVVGFDTDGEPLVEPL